MTENSHPVEGQASAPEFDLRRAFLLRQEQLLATLGVGRSVASHPVAIGDDTELNWKGMLESILPARYQVARGFVFDADGSRSEQIDVLVHDRHFSPVLLEVGDYLYVPAEAVYGVLEIKQEINAKELTYAGQKVASVRRLRRTSAPIPHAGGTFEPREPLPIIGGLLTTGSGWSPALGAPFDSAIEGLDDMSRIDLGCVLTGGGFALGSEVGIVKSEPETSLIFFALRLLKRLQGMASVPAIAYDEYGRILESDSSSAGQAARKRRQLKGQAWPPLDKEP